MRENKNLNPVQHISALYLCNALFLSVCFPMLCSWICALTSVKGFMKCSSFRILDALGDTRKPSKLLVNAVSKIIIKKLYKHIKTLFTTPMKGKAGQVKVSPLLPPFGPIAPSCGKERLNY